MNCFEHQARTSTNIKHEQILTVSTPISPATFLACCHVRCKKIRWYALYAICIFITMVSQFDTCRSSLVPVATKCYMPKAAKLMEMHFLNLTVMMTSYDMYFLSSVKKFWWYVRYIFIKMTNGNLIGLKISTICHPLNGNVYLQGHHPRKGIPRTSSSSRWIHWLIQILCRVLQLQFVRDHSMYSRRLSDPCKLHPVVLVPLVADHHKKCIRTVKLLNLTVIRVNCLIITLNVNTW